MASVPALQLALPGLVPPPLVPGTLLLRLTGLHGTSGESGTSRPSMEVPGPPVSGKPGETSVKWQLCYDMTAKMWWMVSAERPIVPAGVAEEGVGTPLCVVTSGKG